MRYVQHNSRMSDFVTKLTEESRDILTDWLWADFHLYKYFVERHRKRFNADKMSQKLKSLTGLISGWKGLERRGWRRLWIS